MRISGFTFVRNANKYFYPVKASIESILPIVDEFIVALGPSDPDDNTRDLILSIGSEKIKIIDSPWDLEHYPNGMEYARQTDIAMKACSGDWLFYIQSDEVLHEKYLPVIRKRIEEVDNDQSVEGLLFHYRHFWGDFDHYVVSHAWYPREIRVVRNIPDLHSWRDAQSFRVMPGFDGKDYYQKQGTRKLNVAVVDAYIHHYGFVRPPHLMQKKSINHNTNYRGESSSLKRYGNEEAIFFYGDLSKLTTYQDSHPRVLQEWVKLFNWGEFLYPNYFPANAKVNKHEKLKYRVLTWIEQNLLRGKQIGGFKNYVVIRK